MTPNKLFHVLPVRSSMPLICNMHMRSGGEIYIYVESGVSWCKYEMIHVCITRMLYSYVTVLFVYPYSHSHLHLPSHLHCTLTGHNVSVSVCVCLCLYLYMYPCLRLCLCLCLCVMIQRKKIPGGRLYLWAWYDIAKVIQWILTSTWV